MVREGLAHHTRSRAVMQWFGRLRFARVVGNVCGAVRPCPRSVKTGKCFDVGILRRFSCLIGRCL